MKHGVFGQCSIGSRDRCPCRRTVLCVGERRADARADQAHSRPPGSKRGSPGGEFWSKRLKSRSQLSELLLEAFSIWLIAIRTWILRVLSAYRKRTNFSRSS